MKRKSFYQNPELIIINVSADVLTSSNDQFIISGYDDNDFDLGDTNFNK